MINRRQFLQGLLATVAAIATKRNGVLRPEHLERTIFDMAKNTWRRAHSTFSGRLANRRIYDRVPSSAELDAICANPWELYQPISSHPDKATYLLRIEANFPRGEDVSVYWQPESTQGIRAAQLLTHFRAEKGVPYHHAAMAQFATRRGRFVIDPNGKQVDKGLLSITADPIPISISDVPGHSLEWLD